MFGKCVDSIRSYIEKRIDRQPRLKINIETGKSFLDKLRFI